MQSCVRGNSFRSVLSVSSAIQTGSDELSLQSPLRQLKGVGEQLANRLARLGLTQVGDLLFHLPLRYQDRTRIIPLAALRAGDDVLVEGQVIASRIRYGRRRMLLSQISDGSGFLNIRFFHFSRQQQQSLAEGERYRFYGEVRRSRDGGLEMVHPESRHLYPGRVLPLDTTLTPVYPLTEGVGQITLRKLVGQALALVGQQRLAGFDEPLSDEMLDKLGMPALTQALSTVHQPSPGEDTALLKAGRHNAQRRLAFEELLVQQLGFFRSRRRRRKLQAPVLNSPGRRVAAFLASLPYQLTTAQQNVIDDICRDLGQNQPMRRLLQGDVGSGKTVVAAVAAVMAADAGYQAAVMAPTEILAEQHYRTFSDWLTPLGIRLAWLSGKLRAGQRTDMLQRIATGSADIVIGTHALFQEDVKFRRLGFVIIDEQHRFGVDQRLLLRQKGERHGRVPHQLVMTATPIPRTLMMAAYADMDTSVIDEMPPGRQPVRTVIVSDQRRDEVVQRVRQACRQGRQTYWVCPLIDESELLQCQAAMATATLLEQLLPELNIALVHGRMKADDKERVMADFKNGMVNLLVATTVVEVGVDVPNASLMIIENAERLGLAQLHQLRGRVGRGRQQSNCVLMYHAPLSARSRERLAVLRDTQDGFVVAQRDLEMRGPGDVMGTQQTGVIQFRIADLVRDQDLVAIANRIAGQLYASSPQRASRLISRWSGGLVDYAEV